MSDWRSKSSKPRKNPKKSKPVQPQAEEPREKAPAKKPPAEKRPAKKKSRGGWKGKNKEKQEATTEPSWKEGRKGPPSGRKAWFIAQVVVSLIVISALGYLFWDWVFNVKQHPPIFVATVHQYADDQDILAYNPHGQLDAASTAENWQRLFGGRGILTPASWLDDIKKQYANNEKKDPVLTQLLDNENDFFFGGPKRNVAIFYISAIGICDADVKAAKPGEQANTPYLLIRKSRLADASTWLKVEHVLEDIRATCLKRETSRDTFAIVLLDIRTLAAISSPGLARNNFSSAVKATLARVNRPAEKDGKNAHLGVFLPCSQDEHEGHSPKLGGSVFHHYLRRALAGYANGFGGDGENKQLTMGEVDAYVTSHVRQWMKDYRYVPQNPLFLTGENQQQWRSLVLREVQSEQKIEEPTSAVVASEKLLDRVHAAWQKHATLRKAAAYQHQPVAWAELEGRLGRLEHFAAAGDWNAVNSMLDSVNRSFAKLSVIAPAEFLASAKSNIDENKQALPFDGDKQLWPSLVEWQRHKPNAFAHLQPVEADWKKDGPQFLRPKPADAAAKKEGDGKKDAKKKNGKKKDDAKKDASDTAAPAAGDKITPQPDNRAEATWLVWNWLRESKSIISRGQLQKAVKYVESFATGWPDDEEKAFDWLELHFVRLMLRESKGLVEDEKAFMAALREAVRVRHAAQQAACWPNPEVHLFIKERIATVDKLRRQAEDKLFRGQVPKLLADDPTAFNLEVIRQKYEAVQARGNEVLAAIQVREEAFASLPHLACTLLRFQAMDRKQFSFEQQARAGPKNGSHLFKLRDSWDEKWHLLVTAYRALGKLSKQMTLNRWSSFESVPVQLLKENMADLKNWVGDQGTATSTEQNDRVIFRQITALLPSPHLTPRLRQALHLKGKAILDNDLSKAFDVEASSAVAKDAATLRNELWNAFKELPSPEPVLRARSRLAIHQQGKANKIRDVKPTKQDLAKSDQELRKAEAELRAAALAYSVHAKDDPNSYDRVVMHRRGVHRHREHLWQSRRVLNDSWGDGKLVRSNKNWTPYFVRAANHYLTLAQIVDFEYGNSDLWADLTKQIELQRSALSSIQSPRPEELRVRSDRNRSGGEVFERHSVRLVCGQPKHLPDGDLTLSLWKSDMSELLRLHGTTSPKFHSLRLPIPETGQLRQHSLNVGKIGGVLFQTKLSFRGHHWEAEASVIRPNDKFLELTHQVATPRPANITVEGAASIKTMDVVFILDCSGSMLSGGRFAQAKEALKKLWDEMKRGQNEFRVGLFAFGHRSRYTASGSVDSLQEGLLPPDDTQWIYPANGKLSTKASSDGDFQKLEAKLGKLAARGQTPLYLAISDVLKSLPTRTDKTEQRVIVISDGVNYQYPDSDAKNLVSFAKLKQLLEAKKESVKVDLLFLETPADASFWKQVYDVLQNAGLSEGTGAENEFSARRNNAEQIPLLTKGSYVQVDDVTKLADKLNARFPREPQVAIYPASGSPGIRRELKYTWEFSPSDLGEKRVIVEYENQPTPPLKLFLMGGERRTIHFLETANPPLMFPRFSHWSQCRQRQNGVPLMGGDMHSVGLFAAQGVPAGSKRAFQFIFENDVASKFSRRPAFLMAEIQRLLENNKPGRTFNIQDFQFLPDQSVPVARSADLPWFFSENSSQAEATAAKISLWIGDVKAIQAIWSKQRTLHVTTGPTAISKRIGEAKFKIARNNVELLRVNVAISEGSNERSEQWLLDCPEAESVTRQWNVTGKSAIHTFRILPKFWNRKAGVSLRIANVNDVKRHAKRVDFKRLETIRR